MSTVFDPLLGHSQLLPQETPGSALCRSSHSAAADREKVLLSPGPMPSQNLYREACRHDRGFVSTYETLAQRGARDRRCAPLGKGGERLVSKLGIPISDATLLWSLYLVPLPPIGKVEVIGIDDWSYRRGKRYGSIIVDLRTHKIIDLLPERSVASVIAALVAHPGVEIVSRDRGGTYVDGATQGAPEAIQVCDRWHLLKNLGEAVEAFLIRAHIRLPQTATTPATPERAEAASCAPTLERPLTTYSATPAQQGKT